MDMKITKTTTIDVSELELIDIVAKHFIDEHNLPPDSKVSVSIREHECGHGEDPFLTCQVTILHPGEK